MEELVRFIAESLVDAPSLKITSTEEDDFLKINITADEKSLGKIIGKQGKIAKSIRTITRSVAIDMNKKVVIEIN